jgi:hypothetical protein
MNIILKENNFQNKSNLLLKGFDKNIYRNNNVIIWGL